MKKRLFNWLRGSTALLGMMYASTVANAQTATSAASGNWNNMATWTVSGGCTFTPGSGLSSNCKVTIANGHTVTMDISDTVANITISNGNLNSTLAMGSQTLFCIGDAKITANANNTLKTINVNDGTLIVGGNLSINGGSGNTQDARLILNNGSINVQGNISFAKSYPLRNYIDYTGATGIIRYSGTINNNNGGFGDGSGGIFAPKQVNLVVAPINVSNSVVQTTSVNHTYSSLTIRAWQPIVDATATVAGVGNAGNITSLSLTTAGFGYPINGANLPVALTGGSGQAAIAFINTNSLGFVTGVTMTAGNSSRGYQVGDVLTIKMSPVDWYMGALQIGTVAGMPTHPRVTFSGGYVIPPGVKLTVDENAILSLEANVISGAGDFVMKGNSLLRVSSTNGLDDRITNTGTKDLSNGTANNTGFEFVANPGVTGTTMPTTVANLIVNTAVQRTLSQATTVTKYVVLGHNLILTNKLTVNNATIVRMGNNASRLFLIDSKSFPGSNETEANVFGVRHMPCELTEAGFPAGGCTSGKLDYVGNVTLVYSRSGDINIGPEMPRKVISGVTVNVVINCNGYGAILATNDKSSSDGVQNKVVINGTTYLLNGQLRYGSETSGVFDKTNPSIKLPEVEILGPIQVSSGAISAPNPPYGNLTIAGTGSIVGSPFTTTATFNRLTLNRPSVTLTIGTGGEIRVNEKLNLFAGTLDVGTGTLLIRDYDFNKAARAMINVSGSQVTGLSTTPFFGGSGYSNATNVPIPGGTGGLMNVYTQNGAVTHLELVAFGTGYTTGSFTIPGGDGNASGFYKPGPGSFATLAVGTTDANTTYSPDGFTVGQRVAVLASSGGTVGNGAARMQITSVDAFGKITGATVVNPGAGYPNGTWPAILVPFGSANALNVAGGTLNVGVSSTLAFDLENNTSISGISTLAGVENRGSGVLNINQPLTITNLVRVTGSGNINCNGNLTISNNAVVLDTTTAPNGGRVVGTCKVVRNFASIPRYNYVSSPVASAPITVLTSNPGAKATFRYDETHPEFAGPSWVNMPANTNLLAGRGYASYRAGTVTFTGTLNNGNISVPVTYTSNNSVDSIGWNLVGNPYPSPISASAFINANSGLGVGFVYLYDDAADARSSSRYVSINNLGGVTNVSSPSYASPANVIASCQGFFIKVNSSGNINFTNALRGTANNSQFYRDEATKEKLWVAATNADDSDVSTILVGCTADATDGEDLTMDAPKMKEAEAGIALYSLLNNRRYVIQAKDELAVGTTKSFPLGLEVKKAGVYRLNAIKKEGFDDADVVLEDLETGELVDLEESPYSVELSSGTTNNRFVLHLTREEAVLSSRTEKATSGVKVFTDGTSAYIDLGSETEGTVTVLNTIGQVVVAPFAISGNGLFKLNTAINAGVYVVKVVTASGVVSGKVFIK